MVLITHKLMSAEVHGWILQRISTTLFFQYVMIFVAASDTLLITEDFRYL